MSFQRADAKLCDPKGMPEAENGARLAQLPLTRHGSIGSGHKVITCLLTSHFVGCFPKRDAPEKKAPVSRPSTVGYQVESLHLTCSRLVNSISQLRLRQPKGCMQNQLPSCSYHVLATFASSSRKRFLLELLRGRRAESPPRWHKPT